MKKEIVIGRLNVMPLHSVVVAYRQGDEIRIQNLELGENVTFDRTDDTLIIKMKLQNGDFVAFGESIGIAEKQTL